MMNFDWNNLFANLSWWTLVAVMFTRPLVDIFKLKIFYKLLYYRKIFAVSSSVFAILHVYNYLGLFQNFLDIKSWRFDDFILWGWLAFFVMLPLLITSNSFSMRLLKKNWKRLQRLSYFMFVAVALHIHFISKEIGPLVMISVWALLFLVAGIKKKHF